MTGSRKTPESSGRIRPVLAVLGFVSLAAGALLCHDFVLGGGSSPGRPSAPGGGQGPTSHRASRDPRISKDTDPADASSGDFVQERTDVCLPGKGGLHFACTFTYRSRSAINGCFGYGWDMSLNRRVRKLASGNVLALRGDNTRIEFVRTGPGAYIAPAGVLEALIENPSGTFTIAGKNGRREHYDVDGNIVQLEDRNGNTITLTYEPGGPKPVIGPSAYFVNQAEGVIARDFRVASATDAGGRTITFSYDVKGRLQSIAWAGRQVAYAYDFPGNQVGVTYPATPAAPSGSTTSYGYDAGHNLVTITNPLGSTIVTNTYDAFDRVAQQTFGAGTTQIAYFDAAGQPAGANPVAYAVITDRNGNVTRFDFAGGRITRIEEMTDGIPAGEPPSYVTTIAYDAAGNRTRVQYPRGDAAEMTYDARANVVEVRRKRIGVPAGQNDPGDAVTTFTYEPVFDQVTSMTDPRGHTTAFAYDASGNLVQVTHPPVGGSAAQTTFTYDASGNRVTETDPNGNVSSYSYDPASGDLLQVTRGVGSAAQTTVFTYTRDAVGQVRSVTDGEGNTTQIARDLSGHVVRVTAPQPFGYVIHLRYDAARNLVQIDEQAKASTPGPTPPAGSTNPADDWRSTAFTYDALGQRTSLRSDAGAVWTWAFDANGNRTMATDPIGRTTTYTFDERDLVVRILDAAGAATNFLHDANRNLVRITDPNGNATNYAYDDFGRPIRTTYADGSFESRTYDAAGNIATRTNARGQTVTYAHDARNRPTTKVTPAETSTYTYDAAGNLLSAQDADVGIAFEYDALNRLVAEITHPLTDTHFRYATTYWGNSLPKRITTPDQGTIDLIWNQLGRLSRVWAYGGQAWASFEQNPLGQLSAIVRGNGVRTDLRRDAAGNAVETVHRTAQTEIARTYDAWNLLGRQTARSDASGRHRWYYDAVDQPTGVSHPAGYPYPSCSRTYDAAGNVHGITCGSGAVPVTSNVLNQCTGVGGASRTYDLDGNLLTAPGRSCSYDAENLLQQCQGPTTTSDHAYDGLARLYESSTGATTTRSLRLAQYIIGRVDGTGALTLRHVPAFVFRAPIATSVGGNWYYPLADDSGTVTHLTDASGSVVESYAYRFDGHRTPSSAIGNEFGYLGCRHDTASGLLEFDSKFYFLDDYTTRLSRDSLSGTPGDFRFAAAGSAYAFLETLSWAEESGRGPVTTLRSDAIDSILDYGIGGKFSFVELQPYDPSFPSLYQLSNSGVLAFLKGIEPYGSTGFTGSVASAFPGSGAPAVPAFPGTGSFTPVGAQDPNQLDDGGAARSFDSWAELIKKDLPSVPAADSGEAGLRHQDAIIRAYELAAEQINRILRRIDRTRGCAPK